MILSHIIPADILSYIDNRDFYMCLANIAAKDKTYLEFYKKQSENGKFVLLDNGAHEGEQLNNKYVWEIAQIIKPSEIILNDCLCDPEQTLKLSTDSLNYYKSNGYKGQYMFVPQGSNLNEWVYCYNHMSIIDISTIGVAKHLIKTFNNDNARYECCELLEEVSRKIHLLGCQKNIDEVYKIAKRFPNVRSCDTALAYIYTLNDEVCWINDRPNRKINFLRNELNENQLNLLKYNINYMDKLVSFT